MKTLTSFLFSKTLGKFFCFLGLYIALIVNSQAAGFVDVGALWVSELPVTLGRNFTVNFFLKEYRHDSKNFEYIEVRVRDKNNRDIYQVKKWDNVSFSADQTRDFSVTTYLYSNRSPGDYYIVVRGKEYGGRSFDFGVIPNTYASNPYKFATISPIKADVVFSNYGPGNSVDCERYGCGYLDQGLSWGTQQVRFIGTAFTVPQTNSFLLDSINVTAFDYFSAMTLFKYLGEDPVGGFDYIPATFIVSLNEDQNGLPGAVLEQFTFSKFNSYYTDPVFLTGISTRRPRLSAGARYWLTTDVKNPMKMGAGWVVNNQNSIGPQIARVGSEPWVSWGDNVMPAFRIMGKPTSGGGGKKDVAVVLVHGINSSPAGAFSSDGKLYYLTEPGIGGIRFELPCDESTASQNPQCLPKFGIELLKEGFVVAQSFDYSDKTPRGRGNYTIEQLAGELDKHIRCVQKGDCIYPRGTKVKRVDIIAHSMGGLITRAYIAGMALNKDKKDKEVKYEKGVIRKFVMAATPNYGAVWKGLDFNSNQVKQMNYGSDFIWSLNEKWKTLDFSKNDLLSIIGNYYQKDISSQATQSSDCAYFLENYFVVSAASAALPENSDGLPAIAYVPYRHANDDKLEKIGCHGPSIVGVDGPNHFTFQLSKAFLKGETLYDFNRIDMSKERGLLLIRVAYVDTKQPVPSSEYEIEFNGSNDAPGLGAGNNLTYWVQSNTSYSITAVRNERSKFQTASTETVTVKPGRPQSVIIWVTR